MPFILARIFREIWLPAFVKYGQSEQTDTVMVVKACELFLESKLNIHNFSMNHKQKENKEHTQNDCVVKCCLIVIYFQIVIV